MPKMKGFNALFNNKPGSEWPIVHIYSKERGDRFSFVCDFIFHRVLQSRYQVYSDSALYVNAKGLKINYSTESLPGLCIRPGGLLSESFIRKQKPEVLIKNQRLYLFPDTDASALGYDLFSAVFYCISRYEEWQDYTPDNHGRFEAASSLAYIHQQHMQPYVDQWIAGLRETLMAQNPGVALSKPVFNFISTIDIDNLYAYKGKGWWRTMGALARDLVTAKFNRVVERAGVIAGSKKDPFDVYDELAERANKGAYPLLFFFLCRSGTRFDRVARPGSPEFKKVIAQLKEQGAIIGLHPSYDAAYEEKLLQTECKLLSEMAGQNILFSRQHFLRYNIRHTPYPLMALGFRCDFSMGFASAPGFRAGTAYPFNYFDLNKNQAHALLHLPFCFMDGAYLIYRQTPAQEAEKLLLQMANEVKKTGGWFVTVFHESTLPDHLYAGFDSLYKNLHQHLISLRDSQN